MRRAIGIRCLAVVGVVLFGGMAAGAELPLRIDCGTATSPVMAGWQKATEADAYSAQRGWGWEGAAPQSAEWLEPIVKTDQHKGLGWQEYIKANLTPLNRDGVVSAQDLVFRADVPNGAYRVTLWVGDMSKAIGSIKAMVNGQVAENPVTAWTPGGYRSFDKDPLGWWTTVRRTVDGQDGAIRVTLSKDQSYYDAQMAEQGKIINPFRQYWWDGAKEKDPPYWFISYPFTENSLMGIEIVADKSAPVVGKDDKLSLASPVESPALNEAISLFNDGKMAESLAALEKAAEPQAQVARACVALWLAGRLEIESEEDLVPQALQTLKSYAAAHPEETGVAEYAQDADDFMKGLTIHKRRGKREVGQTKEKNHFIENDKAIGWLWLVKEGTPLYYKSQLYIARAGHMLSPYIPVLGTPGEIFKNLEKKFPDNRHVKYYRTWKWEPYGDGSHKGDWVMKDYTAKVQGAPKWVQSLYPAWATLVDWCEWFIRFKQEPEGSIGGGSGDDVEIVGAFGYFGYTGRGVAPTLIPATAKLVDWIYNGGAVDPELGFCLPLADAEHSAEWTGNTLGMMMQLDYGNPLWIERSMKTGKLMRDLWTGYDKNGMRRFRANFFGAARVGGGDQANDSWINYRATRPANAVLWYNRNPAVSKVYIELAGAWLASAMSADRGKPAGVIPAEVSFPEALIGGIKSANWYTACHTPGTVNYDFAGLHGGQNYKDLVRELFIMAYEQTHDPKYFDPLRLEYELAKKYGEEPKEAKGGRLQEVDTRFAKIAAGTWKWRTDLSKSSSAQEGEDEPEKKEQAVATAPEEPGSEKWVAQSLNGVEAWLDAKRTLEGRKGKLENDATKEEIIKAGDGNLAQLKARWPLMTTESSATDRTAYGGIVTPFLIYTGGWFGGPLLMASVTYEDTGREFCAAVLGRDPQGFRLLYYSLAPEEREIGLVPWELEPGGTYTLTYGPDSNDDDVMDSTAERREFVFPQRGTPIRLKVKPRQAYVIEVDQVKRGKGPELAVDPGLSAVDIRYDEATSQVLARIHNVGSKSARDVEVAAYDGDPKMGGTLIGRDVIPNIEAPVDLEPRAVTLGFPWTPSKPSHEVHIVIDPDNKIADEITTFNNAAHKTLPETPLPTAPQPKKMLKSIGGRR